MSHAAARFDNDLRRRDADHPDQTQLTPEYALEPIRRDLGGIGLDPCTIGSNPVGADVFYTVAENGLERPWSGPDWLPSVFVNPPYGEARKPWVERCIEAGQHQMVCLLIPAATDTRIFQRAAGSADSMVFIRGRLKFGTLRPNRRQHAASHPSVLLGWNTGLLGCSILGLLASSGRWVSR